MSELDEKLLQPDQGVSPPRIRLGETGYPGLKVIQKQILEEANRKLRMPHLIREIDEMKKDASISAALDFYRMMIGRVEWRIQAPIGATPQEEERAKFVASCMTDMDQSWFSFIQSILSCIDYGFCIAEKVFKRRTPLTSTYNDGLVGWKSIPVRSQSTISGWVFSEDGRKLTGVQQSLANLQYSSRYSELAANGSNIVIPREKFLLFRTSPANDNPEGRAALKSAWVAWRYKKAVEEQEALGIGRDLGGLLTIRLPARYMSPDASTSDKAVYEDYKRAARNVAVGEQSAIVIPSDYDPETKQAMFGVELLTSQGSRGYDTNQIISRYTNQMLISLFADILQLGNGSSGSFALAGSKQDIISFALDFRLNEIRDVLNNDLIKQTFELNGWDTKRMPTFEFGEVDPISMDELGKFIQRVHSVGALEVDRPVLNKVRETMGIDPKPVEEEPNEDVMNKKTSRAGDGMAAGGINGTSSEPASTDTSSNNMDNAE